MGGANRMTNAYLGEQPARNCWDYRHRHADPAPPRDAVITLWQRFRAWLGQWIDDIIDELENIP